MLKVGSAVAESSSASNQWLVLQHTTSACFSCALGWHNGFDSHSRLLPKLSPPHAQAQLKQPPNSTAGNHSDTTITVFLLQQHTCAPMETTSISQQHWCVAETHLWGPLHVPVATTTGANSRKVSAGGTATTCSLTRFKGHWSLVTAIHPFHLVEHK